MPIENIWRLFSWFVHCYVLNDCNISIKDMCFRIRSMAVCTLCRVTCIFEMFLWSRTSARQGWFNINVLILKVKQVGYGLLARYLIRWSRWDTLKNRRRSWYTGKTKSLMDDMIQREKIANRHQTFYFRHTRFLSWIFWRMALLKYSEILYLFLVICAVL